MRQIDGSRGEGGGQVLRTSLALSLLTGDPVRIVNVRARRAKPGLQRQHLAAFEAAALVGNAAVTGAEVGSQIVAFEPQGVRPGIHRIDVGTAGSTTLVAQTVLLPLALAPSPSTLTITGGTHNPLAPPVEFLSRVWLPAIAELGLRAAVRLDRHGFYPAGGGRITCEISPAVDAAGPLSRLARGEVHAIRASARVSRLPRSIAERELAVLAASGLGIDATIEEIADGAGPGNVLLAEIDAEGGRELASGIGERGVRAETVAARVVDELRALLATDAPVGPHLADQLLLPLAVRGGGCFRTSAPTLHFATQADLIREWLGATIDVVPEPRGAVRVEVTAR
jgi:RNA 3'-terminal phosphate cyclase (ATP)